MKLLTANDIGNTIKKRKKLIKWQKQIKLSRILDISFKWIQNNNNIAEEPFHDILTYCKKLSALCTTFTIKLHSILQRIQRVEVKKYY
jgi:hypothetical protein